MLSLNIADQFGDSARWDCNCDVRASGKDSRSASVDPLCATQHTRRGAASSHSSIARPPRLFFSTASAHHTTPRRPSPAHAQPAISMGNTAEQQAAFAAFDFAGSAAWRDYFNNLTIPPDRANDLAVLRRYRQSSSASSGGSARGAGGLDTGVDASAAAADPSPWLPHRLPLAFPSCPLPLPLLSSTAWFVATASTERLRECSHLCTFHVMDQSEKGKKIIDESSGEVIYETDLRRILEVMPKKDNVSMLVEACLEDPRVEEFVMAEADKIVANRKLVLLRACYTQAKIAAF
ncbi:unnamed protein product [Closterium sp. Yama58-4]|nr:unnamed protein product [Closterium sp. Yama58-4]